MKWKTKNGEIVDIKNMTKEHLSSSLNYCSRRGDHKGVDFISKELNRREEESYYSQEMDCPFCDGSMTPTKFVSDEIEVGFSLPEVEYRYECDNCGATSSEIDGPNLV